MHKIYKPQHSEVKFLAYLDMVSMGEFGTERFKTQRVRYWETMIPHKQPAKAEVLMLPAPNRLISYVGYLAVGLAESETIGQLIPGVNLVIDPHKRYADIPTKDILLRASGIELPAMIMPSADEAIHYETAS